MMNFIEEPMDLFEYLNEHKTWTVISMVFIFLCSSVRLNFNVNKHD
jgi:hypothetical protein